MSWWVSTGTADATEQAEEAEERQRQREAEEAAERERQAEEAAERERERKAEERQRKAEERQRQTDRLRKAARERAMRACTRQEPDDDYTAGNASRAETSGWFSGW